MFSDSSKAIPTVHVVLSFILFVVEKLRSFYYFCSCKPRKSNFLFNGQAFSSCLIIVSLTVLIQVPFYKKLLKKEGEEKRVEKDEEEVRRQRKEQKRLYQIKCFVGLGLSSVISLFTWLILLYSNGDYYVCQQSDWNGLWKEVSGTPLNWCDADPFGSPFSIEEAKSKLKISASFYIESLV